MNATHEHAMAPMGKYHLPSENGPGTSRFLPDVMRRKMGVTYEVYKPITDALQQPCVQYHVSEALRTTHPASDDSAVSEKPRRPQIPARTMTSHTALTGVWVWPFIIFHHLLPGSALSRTNATTTRLASTPCAAPVTNWTTMMKLQIASMPCLPSTLRKSWAIGSGRVVLRRSETEVVAKEAAIVDDPAERGSRTDADEDRYWRCSSCAGGLLCNMGRRVIWYEGQ